VKVSLSEVAYDSHLIPYLEPGLLGPGPFQDHLENQRDVIVLKELELYDLLIVDLLNSLNCKGPVPELVLPLFLVR
jgi:hypothetical protein